MKTATQAALLARFVTGSGHFFSTCLPLFYFAFLGLILYRRPPINCSETLVPVVPNSHFIAERVSQKRCCSTNIIENDIKTFLDTIVIGERRIIQTS